MNVDVVISALNSRNRRRILKILSKYFGFPSDALTIKELLYELREDRDFKVRYRESVYKALERLVDAGLVEKRDEKNRGRCYKVVKTKLEINLAKETIE